MQCVARRWAGTATTCERPPNTAVSQELERRLSAMRQERVSQDSMLFPGHQGPPLKQNDPKNTQVMDIQTAYQILGVSLKNGK